MKYSIKKADLTLASDNKFKDDIHADEDACKNPGIGVRYLQSLLLTLCVFCGYLQRVNLSVTIVAITETVSDENGTLPEGFPKYIWDNNIRSYLLSSFFTGYLIMNFPAAVIGAHVNNKLLLMWTFVINGIITCLTPLLIMTEFDTSNEFLKNLSILTGIGNWRALIILRGIQGLLQAFMFPTIHSVIATWAPPNERSRLVGFIMSGIPFGTTATLIGSGYLCSSSIGWPSVFYVSGGSGILWAVIWWIFGSNNPDEHKTISRSEYLYIRNSIAMNSHNREEPKKIPWKEILTSGPVWAIVIAHTGHNWGFWLLLSEMPTFIHYILGFNVRTDGLLSSLPYLCMWLLQFPVMYFADNFNKRKITSITISRKIWNTVGMWGASISLIILGYLDDNTTAALGLYICAVTIGCCSNVGFNINHMDLTPNYAGILMGMSNGIASTGGLGAPLIAAFLVQDMTSVIQWRMVFYVGAAITFFSNLFFIWFGSGKTQPWNFKYSDSSQQHNSLS